MSKRTRKGRLTRKRKKFAQEYLKDGNGTAAAKRAGFKPKGAHVEASNLLRNPKVQAEMARLLKLEDITAQRVLREIACVGFSNLAHFYDERGSLKPFHELSLDDQAALASSKLTKHNLTAGDDEQEDVVELKLWNKVHALELLAKHLHLLDDVMKVEIGDELLSFLKAGQDRIAAARAKRLKA